MRKDDKNSKLINVTCMNGKLIPVSSLKPKKDLQKNKSQSFKFILYFLITLACAGLSIFLLGYVLGISYCLSFSIGAIAGMFITHNQSYQQNTGDEGRAIQDIVRMDAVLLTLITISIIIAACSALGVLPALPTIFMEMVNWPIVILFFLIAARMIIGLLKTNKVMNID